MPLTLHVSVSRKIGLPAYASAGASCAVQIELDSCVFSQPESFRVKVEQAFEMCRQAVTEELAQTDSQSAKLQPAKLAPGNGMALVQGELDLHSSPLATERQLDFLNQLARQIAGLGGQRLALVAEHRYGHPPNELSSSEASSLIDLLKEIRAGARPLDDLLPDAAA